jgi:hypothetical protein
MDVSDEVTNDREWKGSHAAPTPNELKGSKKYGQGIMMMIRCLIHRLWNLQFD